MPRGSQHHPQPAGVPVDWLPSSLTCAERQCTPDSGWDVLHANLEMHHLRLGRNVLWPNWGHVPVLGLNVEPHSALGILEGSPPSLALSHLRAGRSQ